MAQPIPPGSLLHPFRRHLEAENRSERTLASYLQSVQQAEALLAARGKRLEEASRADLEAFLGDLQRRRAPATAATRYKVLRILYRWLEEEEEIEANPMARMKPPIVPEQPVPVVGDDGLRRLLAVCAGKDFEARRDTAIITLLLDTGARNLPRPTRRQQVNDEPRSREVRRGEAAAPVRRGRWPSQASMR